MKIEVEITANEFDEYVKRRKESLQGIAEKIEACQTLSDWERKCAAGTIRAIAKAIPERKPNSRPGNPSKRIPSDIAVLHACNVVLNEKTQTSSIRSLASDFSVEMESVRKALGLAGKGISRDRKEQARKHWISVLQADKKAGRTK